MSTELDTSKVAQLLNLGTRQMNAGVLSALSKARLAALDRQAVCVPAYTLAPSGVMYTYMGRWTPGAMLHSAQHLAIVILLAAIVVSGMGHWYHVEEQRIGELDVAILTDELPVEVFVDH